MVFDWFKRNKSLPVGETSPAIAEESAQATAFYDVPSPEVPTLADTPGKGLVSRLRQGLTRSREQLVEGVGRLVLGKKVIDAELLDDLEALLLQADLGTAATREIMDSVTERVHRKELMNPNALQAALRESLLDILRPCAQPWLPEKGRSQVLLMVGINGAGKTTTTGKLAAHWKAEGFGIVLAAGDTFRAAAVEQLQGWGKRVQVPVVAQGTGADSASVIFDALTMTRAHGSDLLIADTAGRLHTQGHLMEELKKIKRVLGKQDPEAPQQIWLVLDAGTGQNALNQVRQFHDAVGLTGICITKLDGTAKGGVVAAIAKALPIPIRYIGVGEQIEDLRPFDPESFVDALFAESKS
ncbi:signal recognition particle-docking protein FtsY [Acidithiobacillus ferrivorans]|uniref:Signal recognition particle receptor FtsY n=1 Tax=Acidithiobacillus ferrivorans TaxID=160808 RepID=A0A7T5BH82_9PROT|nr:signal recognition particle-docking protein FtsY [Acidithiobacillus ferrivorans]QQD72338.1 signal recognition particle-docking protein FtsY [Acidithiobacillus ferrivorans]